MKHKSTRITLAVIEVFIALGAIAGGISMLTGTLTEGLPVAWLQGTPFRDYTIPGLLLAVVIGGGMLLAAATVFVQRAWAVIISALAGAAMMIFEIVEVLCIDSKAGAALLTALILQILYFVLGLAVLGLAIYLWQTEYRTQHNQERSVSHV